MPVNPLSELQALGQSIWVDDLRRAWVADGTLQRWIDADGVRGITSNPAIFAKSIAGGSEYRGAILEKRARSLSPFQIYEELAIEDVGAAADLFAPVHRATAGTDGFVSLEVSPRLADDTEGTLREARHLWQALGRPNVMIKVPATPAGVPAIRALIAEGINVNVTLVFDVQRYAEVREAFTAGLEQRAARRESLAGIASVASFFISRIDSAVDARLDALGTPAARALRGGTAIACARLAFEHYQAWQASPRWQRLRDLGAQPQRLLWASTSTKDPAYDPLLYVEALIGPGTVNTLPRPTLQAYRERGQPALRLGSGAPPAQHLEGLGALGIDLAQTAAQLEREGISKFVEPFEQLLAAIEATT
jgi:transaldolase